MEKKRKQLDLTGCQIGNLFVIGKTNAPSHIKSTKHMWYLCRCKCGNEKAIRVDNVKREYNSCGCSRKPAKKGDERKKYVWTKDKLPKSLQRFRNIWRGMRRRCYDETDKRYQDYGGKGIYICDNWLELETFEKEMYESYLEFEKVNGENTATIDRIDNDKPYEPSNCRWATQLEQARNRSTNIKVEINGHMYNSLSEVSEEFDIYYKTLSHRYKRGLRGLELVDKSKLKNTNNINTHSIDMGNFENKKKNKENKNQGS